MAAGLSLYWAHIPHCWKSHVAAQLCISASEQALSTSFEVFRCKSNSDLMVLLSHPSHYDDALAYQLNIYIFEASL